MTTIQLRLALICGLAACGSDSPAAPEPSTPAISGVVPERAFIGRQVRVEISGDNTHWADGTTVSLGDNVTVHSVAVASPTSLFADVTIGDFATAGLTDVTVNGPDGALVLKAGLDLEPPLTMSTIGTLAQGSIVTVKIANQDFETPFDTTMTTFGGAFPNIDIEGPPGTTLQAILSASPFEVDALLTLDVDAQPGELVIENGPRGHGVRLSAGNFAVAARTALPLTPNGITTGGAVDAFETALYEFTPAAAPSITMAAVDNGGFLLLPASGHFIDAFTFDTIPSFTFFDPVVLTSEKYYVIYGDSTSSTDAFQFSVLAAPLALAEETATRNDSGTQAQAVQAPAMFDAILSGTDDVDFVTFPVTAADAGKTIQVITEGDASTVIDVFADPAGTISLGESGGGIFDDFTSQPIPDGTTAIYVEFSAAGDFDPGVPDYLAAIVVNP